MCFTSAGLTATGAQQSAAYNTAVAQAQTEFGATNTEFNDLMNTLNPVVKAGPNQMGYSAPVESAINANSINTTAAAYKNASAAVKSSEAAVGGGNVALPTGVNLGTEEALAEAGAQQESSELNSNLINNAKVGNQNWEFASKSAEAAPEMFGAANQATQSATQAGQASASTQNAITQDQNSWQQLAIGALSDTATVASAGMKSGWGSKPGG
jgi:hypothetical protein